VEQTVAFDHAATYTAVTGSVEHVDASFFTGSFDPFDSSLGTLDSFVIAWNVSNTVTGTLNGSGGAPSASVGGPLTLNGTQYDVFANGIGTGGPPGVPYSFSMPIAATNTFLVSGAGTDYASAFLDAVTGASPFTVAYSSAITVSTTSAMTFDVATLGDLVVTYNYTAAAIPEPAACAAILGLAVLAGTILVRRRVT
jgi:hypothetical protein